MVNVNAKQLWHPIFMKHAEKVSKKKSGEQDAVAISSTSDSINDGKVVVINDMGNVADAQIKDSTAITASLSGEKQNVNNGAAPSTKKHKVYRKGSEYHTRMAAAVADALQGKSLRASAELHGVGREALRSRVEKKRKAQQDSLPLDDSDLDNITPGMKPALSMEEEEVLKRHAITLFEAGFGLDPQDLRNLAQSLSTNVSFQASKGWYTRFMERHPDLTARQADAHCRLRAGAGNVDTMDDFYSLVQRVYDEVRQLQQGREILSRNVHSMDETGVQIIDTVTRPTELHETRQGQDKKEESKGVYSRTIKT